MREQLTLGELIEAAKKIKASRGETDSEFLTFDFCWQRPNGLSSYRGYYNQLAIEWAQYKGFDLSQLIKELESAVGASYQGWKGGDYIMGLGTPLWVANPGHTGDTAIVGLKDTGYSIIIETENHDQ